MKVLLYIQSHVGWRWCFVDEKLVQPEGALSEASWRRGTDSPILMILKSCPDSFNSPPVWEGSRGEIVTVVHPRLLGNATSLHTSRRLPVTGRISHGREICRDISRKLTRSVKQTLKFENNTCQNIMCEYNDYNIVQW